MAAEAVQGHLLQISEVPEQNLSLHAVSREDDAREVIFLLFGFCFFLHMFFFNVLYFLMFFGLYGFCLF